MNVTHISSLRKISVAAAVLFAVTSLHARTPTPDDLFNWAERSYGSLFSGNPTTDSDTLTPYVFRAYANNTYLAFNDEKLFYVGPLSAGSVLPLGLVSNFSCMVYPSECGQAQGVGTGVELMEVTSFLSKYDRLWSTLPSSSTVALSMSDGCYLYDGWTKSMSASATDADLATWQRDSGYRVGSKHTNIAVLAVRNGTNADGSARREIDVQYDINYPDGTTDSAVRQTVISGSSSGSCTTPQTASDLRWFGNRRDAAFAVTGRNLKYRNYKLVDGTLNTSQARRELQFSIRDPQQKFTYAIITGNGPATTINGTSKSFALKMISPRILASDPLLAGKTGNFTNWKLTGFDLDIFRTCRSASSSAPHAELADCAGQGAGGPTYGTTIQVGTTSLQSTVTLQDLVAADNTFNRYGFGGKYTVALYNDDGWKTVNGQAGKTPVVSYTTNDPVQLPFSFASLSATTAGSFDALAKYPGLLDTSAYSPVSTAALLRSGVGGAAGKSIWTASIPVNNGDAYRISELAEYFEGAETASASYPAERWYSHTYPGVNSTQADVTVTAKPSSIVSKRYAEYDWWFSNRNGGRVALIHTYQ